MPKAIYNTAYRELIETVVTARAAAGLTQQTVADRLGKPQSFVAKVEGCERRLDVIELLELAAAIGFDPRPTISATWTRIKAHSSD